MPKEHTLSWKHLDFDQEAGREVNTVQWLGDADTRNGCKLKGLQSLYLICGNQGYPHMRLWICIRTHSKGILGQEQAILGLFPASISRVGECCSPSWLSASSTSCTSHETHFLSYTSGREQRGWAWSSRHRLQGHSRSDHVCEVCSCPAQGCSGSQLQQLSVLGNRMLKDGASWVCGRTSELKLLEFLPWAQVPGHTQCLPGGLYLVLVCTLLHHACSS